MVLITGANGLVGSNVSLELLNRGIDFKALVRESSDLSLLEGVPQDHLVIGDVMDEISLEHALQEVDIIIHCAAIISFDPSEQEKMYEVNVEGTRNILNHALSSGVKKFIHLSSVAAVAVNTADKLVNENNKWPGSSPHTYYGKTKYQAELELFRAAEEGLEVHCFNPSIILGPGDWDKSSTRLFKYVYNEKKFYTDGFINYVDIRDLVELLIRAIEKPGSNKRYIVSAGSIPYKEFFEKVASKLNKKPPTVKATPLAVKLSVLFSKLGSLLTGKAPLITRETARNSQRQITYDNTSVTESFNFSFRKLDETVAWVSNELLKKGYSHK